MYFVSSYHHHSFLTEWSFIYYYQYCTLMIILYTIVNHINKSISILFKILFPISTSKQFKETELFVKFMNKSAPRREKNVHHMKLIFYVSLVSFTPVHFLTLSDSILHTRITNSILSHTFSSH